MPAAALVGSDVCVMPAAFPDEELTEAGSVGWRGLVTGKRGSGENVQVEVFGAWFKLQDESRIRPITQLEEGEGEAEGEEGEEEGEEEEGESMIVREMSSHIRDRRTRVCMNDNNILFHHSMCLSPLYIYGG